MHMQNQHGAAACSFPCAEWVLQLMLQLVVHRLATHTVHAWISLAPLLPLPSHSPQQIVVQGIPWAYTQQELKDLFTDIGNVDTAEVMMSPDGRSKVGSCAGQPGSQVPLQQRTWSGDCKLRQASQSQAAHCVQRTVGTHCTTHQPAACFLPCWQQLLHPCCMYACLPVQGWGTVRFHTTDAANAAISQFHGYKLEGRPLTVFLDKKA
jgi:RNA recognition motif-containing protein